MDDDESNFAQKVAAKERQALKKLRKAHLLLDHGHRAGTFGILPPAPRAAKGNSDNSDISESEHVDATPADNREKPRCTKSAFIILMSQLLTFHAYYKQQTFWKKNDPNNPTDRTEAREERKLDAALQIMLRQLVTTLDRNTGYGWNIQKVHEVFFHLVRQIRESGRPSNADCQVGERGLKVWGKHDAQRARKGNVAVFTKSVCDRIHENSVMRRAQLGMGYESNKMRFCSNPNSNVDNDNIDNGSSMVGLPKYTVHMSEITDPMTGACVLSLIDIWVKNNRRIGEVKLPKLTLRHIENLYFSNDDDPAKYKNRTVKGFTEYRKWCAESKEMIVYRSHPNYHNDGEQYDWAIIRDPFNGDDLRFGETSIKSHRKTAVRHNAVPATVESYVDVQYGEGHVPARIVALVKSPRTGRDCAIVHPCRPWMVLNQERSSVISESWHLQHKVHASDGLQHPVYAAIKARDLVGRIRVFMETTGIQETWPDREGSGHVILLTKRSKHWASAFLTHE
jgi:hypothetical protein